MNGGTSSDQIVLSDVRSRFAQIALDVGWGEDRSTIPALSPEELAREPLKWLKYIVLDRAGVEPLSRVERQIHRFRLSDLSTARTWIKTRLADQSAVDRQVIAKVVPWERGAQLANFRILREDEVDATLDAIATRYTDRDYELWSCESSIAASGLNLGGRISYPRDGLPQVVELVWLGSPRMIEAVDSPGFSHPYLKASRAQDASSFTVDRILSGPTGNGLERADLENDFVDVLHELSARERAMRRLVGMLRKIGANEVCFCFKISDGHLTVIDWDTEIESTAR